MNHFIAQLVALTCHGNAFLRGAPVPKFFPGNSTCKFCDRVTFGELSTALMGKPKETVVADSPDQWFEHLRSLGARGILLAWEGVQDLGILDRMKAAYFTGDGDRLLRVLLPEGRSAFWRARWEVWNREAPEQRIWRVVYGQVGKGNDVISGTRTLAAVKDELLDALRKIRDFAQRQDCRGFTESFDRAMDALTTHSPASVGYHTDLAPAGALSPEAAAMLDAAQQAWVFGGMGSWNDMAFNGEAGREYAEVTPRLFRLLNEAAPAAANASFKKSNP